MLATYTLLKAQQTLTNHLRPLMMLKKTSDETTNLGIIYKHCMQKLCCLLTDIIVTIQHIQQLKS